MDDTERDVEHINMAGPTVLMTDGEIIPVVAWLDQDNDVEDDPDSAVKVVAGPDREGYFYTINIDPTPLLAN